MHSLVIDDDADTRQNLRDLLELDDHSVETAATVAETLARDDWNQFSIILLDRRLPDGSGEELLPKLRQLAPDAAVVVVTGYADLQGAIAALRLGAVDYILKPVDPEALRRALRHVQATHTLQEQERSLLKAQCQFEQFFTPQLAHYLRQEPDLLDGREAEVTLLFCDVRNFSGLSERLGPARTVEWIGSVMTELSRCVLGEEGVLVDYVGDELVAMWGAPALQPDQARRAARAALNMLDALTELNRRWEAALGQPMDLGIGLNTGLAQVGNTGSTYKFKYGPLGDTVNVASRVQGLTKYLGRRLLVTASTRAQLDQQFIARRVVRARLVNILRPVDLYEVEAAGRAERLALFRASEDALVDLEEGRFVEAAWGVAPLLREHPGDGALLLTLARAANALMERGSWDPVWKPPGK
jgi:class 3 adenylate cyclase